MWGGRYQLIDDNADVGEAEGALRAARLGRSRDALRLADRLLSATDSAEPKVRQRALHAAAIAHLDLRDADGALGRLTELLELPVSVFGAGERLSLLALRAGVRGAAKDISGGLDDLAEVISSLTGHSEVSRHFAEAWHNAGWVANALDMPIVFAECAQRAVELAEQLGNEDDAVLFVSGLISAQLELGMMAVSGGRSPGQHFIECERWCHYGLALSGINRVDNAKLMMRSTVALLTVVQCRMPGWVDTTAPDEQSPTQLRSDLAAAARTLLGAGQRAHAFWAAFGAGVAAETDADLEDAERWFGVAQRCAAAAGSPQWGQLVLQERARVAERRGHLVEALTLLSKAVADAAGVQHRTKSEQVEALRSRVRVRTLEEERRVFQRASLEDPLTSLANRRAFDGVLVELVSAAGLDDGTSWLAVVDVDHFKHINDSLTHQVGDVVLKRIAEILREACRKDDWVARFAGDEFVLISRSTNVTEVAAQLERLMDVIRFSEWSAIDPGLSVTVSIGCAPVWRGTTPDELFAVADRALIQAKRSGRNTYVLAKGYPASTPPGQ
jgi:diguanylate cyclase (GGDEF)-like protein